jgi:1-acyl-sn-glycerol-3-phosphate acyltransferase
VQFATSKRAIILSAITTLVGIGALIFAEHPAIKSIALLTIIGISATLIITFTIEPFIYNIFVGRRKEEGLIPFTLFSVFTSAFAFSYFLFGCILLTILRWLLMLPFGPLDKRKAFFHWTISKFCGSLMYIMANTKKVIIDRDKADYSKPAVVIANHHSFLDILILLMLYPKQIMVTNSWVYNSPFFGKTVQFADFIHAQEGMESQFENIKAKVAKGYSVIVFPEGSRSSSPKLRRFHKGAFFLAEQLNIDIQPIVLHGTEFTMPKGDTFYLKNGTMTVQFLDRIAHDDESFGTNYSERTKLISKHFKAEHKKLRLKQETPTYYKELMLKNYLYRSPILEWYFKVKTRLENNYELFHRLVPLKAKVMDLGCGYGFMSYALALSSEERKITALDYDGDKIEVANDGAIKPQNLIFMQGDVAALEMEPTDVFILSDVLHYLNPQEQNIVMQNMADNLNEGGKIIVRDSDSSNKNRHQGSKLTEFFSTNFGFNQTRNKLNFVPRTFFEEFAAKNNLSLEVIDNTKLTSNLIFVITQKR